MRSLPSSALVFALLGLAGTSFAATAAAAAPPIDRQAVVSRHNVHVTSLDPESALSVGNGDFAFTVDATGLQSFPKEYYDGGIPLETLSTWAWHSFPNPDGLKLDDAMMSYDFHGRTVKFAGLQSSPAGRYFRENPHPIPLGQIGLLYKGRPLTPADIGAIDQQLDLWTGVVRSRYTLGGQPVTVETVAHPGLSEIAVSIHSPLVQSGDLEVRFHFAYSYLFTATSGSAKNKPPLIWDQPEKHRTRLGAGSGVISLSLDGGGPSSGSTQLERTLDDSKYFVNVAWQGEGKLTEAAPHDFHLKTAAGDALTFTCTFAPDAGTTSFPSLAGVRTASAEGWKDYWTKGGMIDLAGSTDPRAAELERRVVLSLYLMKVNYAGSVPPAETGLASISWYGKHNSEVYFWHAAQFYEWGHTDLLEKGLSWYRKILPSGQAEAAAQGFDGVRWPKMSGIDGRTGPGTINPFIIWNQPNPIALCELVWRAHRDQAILEKYRDVVFESAKFLASFAVLDPKTNRYVLGPPIKNVSEKAGVNDTQNPTFELAYWYYGLSVAQTWRARLGLPPEPHWADVMAKLSKLTVSDGKYVEIETEPEIFAKPGSVPTTMFMAYGYMPPTPMVDPAVMRTTWDEVNRRNGPLHWASWQIGEAGMTAARLGLPDAAVAILTNAKAPATPFMNSGYVRRPKEPNDCPTYLPVNASLLDAVGLMAAGWDNAPKVNTPGFPQDGKWNVKWEGLNPMP